MVMKNSKREEIAVRDTPLVVSMAIRAKSGAQEFECGWWEHSQGRLVTDDCRLTGQTQGFLSCSCSHLTDFFAIYSQKVVDRFKEVEWKYFGIPTYVKPILRNSGLWFDAIFTVI